MYPILWQGDGWTFATWHLFYVLGAMLAWWTLHAIRPYMASELPARDLDLFYVLMYIISYMGARGLSIVVEKEYNEATFKGIASLFELGAMTLYGGMLAGTTTLVLLSRWKKIAFITMADLFAAPLLLGVFLGRIGCFFNGDDYGRAVPNQEIPPAWSVSFPNLADNVYRYPVQIWESAYCGLLALFLLFMAKRSRVEGRIADIAVVGYAFGRLLLEDYRGDERGSFIIPALSTSQGISILVLLAWIIYRNYQTFADNK